ncbi:MAG: hypothetical protein FD137_2098 [Spirochaetes bacterium]|nr:MAG: hypothetical protein FD137_2098 [Spirochaetota bacterium]
MRFSFKEEILDELQDGLANTATELKAARDEAFSALEEARTASQTVEKRFETALNLATQRAGDIEDRAFTLLIQNMEERRQAFSSSLETKLADLGQEVATMTGELRKAMDSLRQSWRDESQAMMKDMAAKLQELESIFAAKATEIADLLETSFDKAKATEYSLASTADTSKRELAENLEKIKALDSGLDERLEATKNRIEDEFAAFGQAFEGHRTRFEENFAEETSTLENRLGSLRSKVEEMETLTFQRLKGNLEKFEEGLSGSLVAKKVESFKKLDAWLSELQNTLNRVTEEAKARRLEEEAANQREFKASLLRARDEMYVHLAKLASDLDALEEGLKGRIQEAELDSSEAQPS